MIFEFICARAFVKVGIVAYSAGGLHAIHLMQDRRFDAVVDHVVLLAPWLPLGFPGISVVNKIAQ